MKRTRKTPARGPIETVTVKGASVGIYRTPRASGGKTYDAFTLVYTSSGRRCRKLVADLDKARATARTIASQLSEGTGHVHALTPSQVADYHTAERTLRRHPATSLATVVEQWAEAMRLLPPDTPLTVAAKFYADHITKEELPTITPKELAALFIAAKEREELSDFYLQDVKRKLARFAKVFCCPVASITGPEITKWIESQGTGRNANNLRGAVSALFGFGRARGYLPAEKKHAAELVPKFKERVSKVGIYEPQELKAILDKAPPRLVPVLAVCAFAGLRVTEAFRLDWKEIRLGKKNPDILVAPEKSKTASRRIVPICPALAAWLEPHKQDNGAVAVSAMFTPAGEAIPYTTLENISRIITAAVEAAGVKPQRNGFRHSFASYRLAQVQSADKVALEMGNSPRKLFANYNEAVPAEEARAWFNVRPSGRPKNVVPMSACA